MSYTTKDLQEAGFLIVRECIPPAMLEPLRADCEMLLKRHIQWWSDHRGPDDPPGGEWETSIQPRAQFQQVVDPESADIIEFVFHDNTYGLSKRLMDAQEAAPLQFTMFCNPRKDCGPADWHRDIRSWREGPIEGLMTDTLANPPGYLQWNIALYDDDVLWIVPGTHKRFITESERQQLSHSEFEPLDSGQAVQLRAGDAVVYLNTNLHWGSNYSTKLRRTLQFTYRAFGGHVFPHARSYNWGPDIFDVLPPHLATKFERFLQLETQEFDVVERTCRAAMAKNERAFMDGLAELHPGEQGREYCLILLAKTALVIAHHPRCELRERFTQQERAAIGEQFEVVDRMVKGDEPMLVPGFQNKEPTPYFFHEMPKIDLVGEFLKSW